MNAVNFSAFSVAGLLEKIIDEASANQRRQHELKVKELEVIAASSLRDDYVKQLFLDKFLAPIETAHHQIQNTAKHAQWLAEIVNYYYGDHGLNQQQGQELSTQLRLLAIKITQSESLHDLKFIYGVTTLFTDKISAFKHKNRNYCLERSIRRGILEPLNTCIATTRNFQQRLDCYDSDPMA